MARAVKRVLVTDAEQRAALAVVRSLGRAGYVVLVGAHDGADLAGASRFCRQRVELPNPLHSPVIFAKAVSSVVVAHAVDAIVPISEQSLLALLDERDNLPNVLLPFPSLETFRGVSDKRSVLDAANRIGIRVPRQVCIESPSAAEAVAASLTYPVVLKPARSVGDDGTGFEKHGVSYAATETELRERLRQTSASGFPLLLQEKIEGEGAGIFLLRWNGTTIALFAHKRLREKPPSGGVSTYAESIEADPEMVTASERLLDVFGWNGVAMVEYKFDAVTRQPVLMEINGRFWGSLQLAIDSGVDFPRLLLQAASGERPTRPRYHVGVRYRWLLGDVDALIKVLSTSRVGLSVPASFPSRAAYTCAFMGRSVFERWDSFDAGDPMPFLAELMRWLRVFTRAMMAFLLRRLIRR